MFDESRFFRCFLGAAVLFALTGVAYRALVYEPADRAVEAPIAPQAPSRRAESAAPQRQKAPDLARRAPPPAIIPAPPKGQPTPEEQTDAIREAVVRDAVKTIRLAAIRGDEATVRGLAAGLRYNKPLARRVLDDVLAQEQNDTIRTALEEVKRKLD
jgi:DNA replication initiation complex subunit (GINS family)